ncbi:hypothetical protein [Defluviitalea saccharophila]|uniref:Cyclic lactone autoinducer peptide n=1 Tax=Defluviitalea saccharophila TaxID=879970 RepID=A0ABZ2Y300_9FIRM|nr:hypothetical protein [Candidatus Epulonipiscium sp.]NLM13237.1 hypothetical protein [Candidatus Epulonipiscium sp.]
MEIIKYVVVSLFSIFTLLLLASQCKSYAMKKGQELVQLLSKDKQI